MQVRDVVAALALVLAAGPAGAASRVLEDGRSLRLEPGERVVVRLAGDGSLSLVSTEPAPPSAALPPKPGSLPEGAPLTDAAPGTVVFVLGEGAMRLDSGLDHALDYRAVDGEGRPLAVCTALPLLASYEAWPYRVSAVVIDRIQTRATNEVVCTETPSPGIR